MIPKAQTNLSAYNVEFFKFKQLHCWEWKCFTVFFGGRGGWVEGSLVDGLVYV